MIELRDRALEIMERVRQSWIARYRPESQLTDWGQSLAMFGLLRSLNAKYDEKVYQYLRTWVHFHLNERIHVNYFCGSWSFGILYPEIVKFFPEMKMQLDETAENIFDFIEHKSLRNGDGIILHNVDLPNIYIDTVYYSAVPLAKLGTYLNREWEPTAWNQIGLHLGKLRDGNKPFYIHCEENASGKRSQGAWARGNGWVMMTSAELMSLMDDPMVRSSLLSRFDHLASAITPLQTQNGLWRTILDDETAYEESSASAMYLFALARCGKSLEGISNVDAIVNRAFDGLEQCVDAEGKFTKVSEGTWPGTTEYYKSLSRGEWWWGTGAYLLALSEIASQA